MELLDCVGWEGILRIRVLRKNLKKWLKTNGICKMISTAIKDEFGLPIKIGVREGVEHWWNVLPSGSILDASADQFGDEPIIVIAKTADKRILYCDRQQINLS